MDFFFYGIPSLIIALMLFMAYKVVGRTRDLTTAWSGGLTAEARCLRTYTTTHSHRDEGRTTTSLHHVYEFTTREGRTIRFEEADGPGTTIEGDIVVVHYAADKPEKATAQPPRRGAAFASAAGILIFFGVIIAFCIGFMITYGTVFADADPSGGFGDDVDF